MGCLTAPTHQYHCQQEVRHKMALKIQISKNQLKDMSLKELLETLFA